MTRYSWLKPCWGWWLIVVAMSPVLMSWAAEPAAPAQVAALAKTLEGLTQAREAIRAGRFADAKEMLSKAIPLLVAAHGEKHAETYRARWLAALLELESDQFAAAAAAFASLYPQATAVLGEKHPLTATISNDWGVALYRLARFADSRAQFTAAMAIRQQQPGVDPSDRLQTERNWACCERALGNEAQARQLFQANERALKDLLAKPRLEPALGAEAVRVVPVSPQYPQLELFFAAYAPGQKVEGVDLRRGDAGYAEVVERLGCVRLQLEAPFNPHGLEAARRYHKLFGVDDPRTSIARLNSRAADIKQKQTIRASLAKRLGEDHSMVVGVDRDLALRFMENRQYAETRPLLQKVYTTRQRLLGNEHPDTNDALELWGLFAYHTQYHDTAQRYFEQLLGIRARINGLDHPHTATAMVLAGISAYQRGDYPRARRLIERGYQVRDKVLGANAKLTATALGDLAVVTKQQGDYATARRYLEKALADLRRTVGDKDFTTQRVATNLCVVQLEMGDYAGAGRYLQDLTQGNAPDFIKDNARINLGSLARARGDRESAVKIWEDVRVRQADHPEVLNGLGAVYRELGRFELAEERLSKALAGRRLQYGEQHPETAFSLTSLGLLYQARGDLPRAADLFQQALGIYQTQQGSASQRAADLLTLLGKARLLQGDLPTARRLLSESASVKQTLARTVLPTLAEAEAMAFVAGLHELEPLLSVHRLLNDPPAVAHETVWRNRALVTRVLASRRRLAASTPALARLVDQLASVRRQLAEHLQSRQRPDKFRPFSPTNAQANVPAKISTFAPPTREQYEQKLLLLNEEKERLEREIARQSEPYRRQSEWLQYTPADLATVLPADTALVEFVLAQRWLRADNGKISLAPARYYEAFVVSRPWRPKAEKAAAADQKPMALEIARVDLGPAGSIDEAVERWRGELARASALPRGDRRVKLRQHEPTASAGQQLRRLVWEPLHPHLQHSATVLVVADGALTRVPLGALPGGVPHSYLLEEKALAQISDGQQLVHWLRQPVVPQVIMAPESPQSKTNTAVKNKVKKLPLETNSATITNNALGKMLLLGAVSYDMDEPLPRSALAYREPTTRGPAEGGWSYLPGTEAEIHGIQSRVSTLKSPLSLYTLSGKQATKAAFHARIAGCRYLHLATHGFFADPSQSAATSVRDANPLVDSPAFSFYPPRSTVLETLTGRNPLVLSGLVLAGANRLQESASALLTAEEVADLDLGTAELVVLSACETGLGTVAGGEGVLGLQRSFALAGARATLASLWQVDDDATRALMGAFYQNLWERKLSKLESLRQAQLALMKGELLALPAGTPQQTTPPARLSPFYWAAFVLSGDPR